MRGSGKGSQEVGGSLVLRRRCLHERGNETTIIQLKPYTCLSLVYASISGEIAYELVASVLYH